MIRFCFNYIELTQAKLCIKKLNLNLIFFVLYHIKLMNRSENYKLYVKEKNSFDVTDTRGIGGYNVVCILCVRCPIVLKPKECLTRSST